MAEGRRVTAAATLSSTTKTTLYTVPIKHRAAWSLMYIISLTSNDSPSVFWYDSSKNTEYSIVGGKNLGAGDYILFNGAEVILEEGDEIRVQNSTTNTVTYVATVEAILNPSTQRYNG